eukprot:CAMPEP_0117023872 /NCGR_PEP_ID=MMETSP0472-20121206/17779_1 /TAXON_ID=693140 ORGANISM="Tiarina fusus, Strain LIS" /NCGR_SAMPLE_ID=MMETSP0472 /ASSEMBLY_ACC=CAM_ASM_000603 /LENGTH=219 /DNA_ID=CAMNT_0004730129 /DNA_START=1 /DNA_END=657 /DNA_ORIENTATION=+
MTDGRIPMGFSCHSLWSVAHEKFSSLPKEISEKKQKIAALSETIQKLQKELEIASETHASLQSEIAPLTRFCETKLTPLIDCSAVFAGVEKKLNFSVDSHFADSTVDELISLDHGVPAEKNETIPPKISILFNCAGICHDSIKKLSTVDGEEFTDSNIGEMAIRLNLPFREKLMLKELQIMFEEERVPADIAAHKENCALCAAATPQEARYLLEEHNRE